MLGEVLFGELDGWVLGAMKFGVLVEVEVLFGELDGWCQEACCFASLTAGC